MTFDLKQSVTIKISESESCIEIFLFNLSGRYYILEEKTSIYHENYFSELPVDLNPLLLNPVPNGGNNSAYTLKLMVIILITL
jgi:hypothetical protein